MFHIFRWRFVIHGGVDGYSRCIVFLTVSANNRQETVAASFVDAVTRYGLPSRIRVDRGGENNTICHIMETIRGPNRGSAIRGRSVHNQRVERSWVDLWNGVTNVYSAVFHYLEDRRILDVDDELDLWVLHFVYMPRIQRDVSRYVVQWNNHKLRTEHHATPLQLFVRRTLQLNLTNLATVEDVLPADARNLLEQHWAPAGNQEQAVTVPEIQCPLTEEQIADIQANFDPLENTEADNLGLQVYRRLRSYVQDL